TMQTLHPPAFHAARRSGSNPWRVLAFLSALFALCAIAASARAQSATGTVSGTVVDGSTGKFLEGADVTVEGTALHATTERQGAFTLRDVPPGPRNIVVSYPGLE